MKGTAKIIIEAPTAAQVQELADNIQFAVSNVNVDDLNKLLKKVRQNPSLIKSALKFI